MYVLRCGLFFFFKQKTAYEMRISDWSSDVCSSDLLLPLIFMAQERQHIRSLLKIFIFAAFAIELVGVIVATTLSYAEAHAMLGGEFLAGNGRLGSFAGESNRNALLVASTLPMVA